MTGSAQREAGGTDRDLPERSPSHRAAASGRRLPVVLAGVAALIAVPTAALAGWIHGPTAGLLATLLGPWAGLAVGHRDCTMATQWPEATWTLVASGVGFVLLVSFVRRRLVRTIAPTLFAVWLLGWCWTAILSLINTSS